MIVKVKLLSGGNVTLGDLNNEVHTGIGGDCSNKQQFIWHDNQVLTTVNTFVFIKDLITVIDNNGISHIIDSDTPDCKIIDIKEVVYNTSYGSRRIGSVENNHDSRKIILKDDNETRYEIQMCKQPYEVTVTMYK